MLDFLSLMISSLLEFINNLGYIGIFLGMAIESSFFPFPSEVILIPAGALIADGQMNFYLVFLAGLLGSLAGAAINFFLALHLGRKTTDFLVSKYGRFFLITKERLEHSDNYFKSHGEITTFIGRLIPGIRQVISVPAGFSRMNFSRFLFFTGLGAGLWALLLIYVGYFFGKNQELISRNLDIAIFITIILSITVVGLYLFLRKKSR